MKCSKEGKNYVFVTYLCIFQYSAAAVDTIWTDGRRGSKVTQFKGTSIVVRNKLLHTFNLELCAKYDWAFFASYLLVDKLLHGLNLWNLDKVTKYLYNLKVSTDCKVKSLQKVKKKEVCLRVLLDNYNLLQFCHPVKMNKLTSSTSTIRKYSCTKICIKMYFQFFC